MRGRRPKGLCSPRAFRVGPAGILEKIQALDFRAAPSGRPPGAPTRARRPDSDDAMATERAALSVRSLSDSSLFSALLAASSSSVTFAGSKVQVNIQGP